MTFSLTANFFGNARGLTLTDSATVTWAFNKSTNSITATATGVGGGLTSVGFADTSATPIYTVTNSPLIANGTIDITLSTQVLHSVFAGPAGGGAAQPTFRALVAGDIPALSYVTSVGLADGSTTPIYTITGSPDTSTGTLTFTLATQLANRVFAGATSGGAAQPGFRALVAADIPTIPAGQVSGLATVATSGAYADLSGRPTIPASIPGPPGEDGLDGDHGPPGERGLTGAAGPSGLYGPPGDDGLDGDHGPPGERGLTGASGAAGAAGVPIPGEDGMDGDHGPPGERGLTGAPGAAGSAGAPIPGEDGMDGDHGPPGERGLTGATGVSNMPGPPGPPGDDGLDGEPGPMGPPGVVPLVQTYTPDSVTVPTGFFLQAARRQQWTTTQRLTLRGTARLAIG